MPIELISCISLPNATISSVPIADFAVANELLAKLGTEQYYSCCGKSICGGCIDSFVKSGNIGKCPFCNSDRADKTDEGKVEELMKRVEANDAGAMYILGSYYDHGQLGLQQDLERAIALWKQAAKLGSSKAHFFLGVYYDEGGDLKRARRHFEAAARAGHEVARYNLGTMEHKSGNMERSVKHSMIAASAGDYNAMNNLLVDFEEGLVSRDVIDSTLTAYNNSCAEMRSEARDKAIRMFMKRQR
jgi:tetratricopeptide (TPR) repeat protein